MENRIKRWHACVDFRIIKYNTKFHEENFKLCSYQNLSKDINHYDLNVVEGIKVGKTM